MQAGPHGEEQEVQAVEVVGAGGVALRGGWVGG